MYSCCKINVEIMKQLLLSVLFCWVVTALYAQENYVLETRFRNPVDTTKFKESPTLLLFVHSKCQHGHLCPTTRMQKALETDSLGFRRELGMKLYVIYPKYSSDDIQTFDSFMPTDKTVVAFYTKPYYKGTFYEGNTTPYVVFYDGRGHVRTKIGGTIVELKDSIYGSWR